MPGGVQKKLELAAAITCLAIFNQASPYVGCPNLFQVEYISSNDRSRSRLQLAQDTICGHPRNRSLLAIVARDLADESRHNLR